VRLSSLTSRLCIVGILILVLCLCAMVTTSSTVEAMPATVAPPDYSFVAVAPLPAGELGSTFTPSAISSRDLNSGCYFSGSMHIIHFDRLNHAGAAAFQHGSTQGDVFFGQHAISASSDNVSADFAAHQFLANTHDYSSTPGWRGFITLSHGPDVIVDCSCLAAVINDRESFDHSSITYRTSEEFFGLARSISAPSFSQHVCAV